MKYCTNCGKKLNDDASFCQYCGHAINEGQSHSTTQKQNNKNISPKIVIIVIVLTLAIVGFLVYWGINNDFSFSSFNNSQSSIEVISENLYINVLTDGSYYISAKVKNTSSQSIKVNFYGRILNNDTVVREGYSDTVYLNPGETGTVSGFSYSPYIRLTSDNYSYRIEKWNVYRA